MQIENGQIMGRPQTSNIFNNPWGGRLNSASEEGWQLVSPPFSPISDKEKVFLRINLKENSKVVYMEYQFGTKLERYADFYIKFGLDENAMEWYSDEENSNPVKTNILYIPFIGS